VSLPSGGWVELRRQHSDAGSAELTIALDSKHQGQGYAAKAASQLIDWAFDRLPLESVVPENVASKRLMARIGMTLVGETQIPSRRTGELIATLEYERTKRK
jgi:RimJ/RimL family protein N-acetyltransferase